MSKKHYLLLLLITFFGLLALGFSGYKSLKGYVFTTQVGEITIRANEFVLLTKSLKPLPQPKVDANGNEHDAFSDPEQRYRQRYVDLTVNPHVRETFIQRTQLVNIYKR